MRKTKQFYLLGKALLSLCVIALIGTACTSAGVAVAPPPVTTLTPSSTSGEKFSEGPSPTPFLYPPPSPTFTPAPTPSPALPPLCPGAPEQGNWKCQENRLDHTRTCLLDSLSESQWACYEDLIYRFAMEYPPDWNASVTIDTRARSDVLIARRHSFWGPHGALDVDIWHPTDPDLSRWLVRHRELTGPDIVLTTEPNAKVGGYPAVAFVDNPETISPMFSVFLSNGVYTYRLWFTLYTDPEEIPIIRQVLDTFRFSAHSTPAEIPEEVWKDIQRAIGRNGDF